MADLGVLHHELSAFASDLTERFDLAEALHRLSDATARSLGLNGAGVTVWLPNSETQYVTGTDAVTLHVERRQDELREGVCVDAMTSVKTVTVADIMGEDRWPNFAPVVLDAGFRAVAGAPIRWYGEVIGALNLYDATPRQWADDDVAASELVANMACGYLVNSRLRFDAERLSAQLQQALDTRIIIEQAKGVLAGRHSIAPDAAFEILRGYARTNRVKLHDVARDVVHGAVDPVDSKTLARPHADAGHRRSTSTTRIRA